MIGWKVIATAAVALFAVGCDAEASPFWFDEYLSGPAWLSAGHGPTNDHYAPYERLLSQYTVPFLTPRWVFTANSEVWGTPTVEGDAVYASDFAGTVWRIDARTGTAVWQTKLPPLTGITNSFSRNSPAIGRDSIVLGDQKSATLFALSKTTGAPQWKTVLATNGYTQITSSPVIVDNRVYVGVASGQEGAAAFIPGTVVDFRGSVVALDLATGKIIWQTYTVPPGYTGGAVWSGTIAVDTHRQAIYLTTGNNYTVPAAVTACQNHATTSAALDACLDPANHIDSIISLDMKTGSVIWAQRFTHADTWTVSCVVRYPAIPCPTPTGLDVDFGSGANLVTIRKGDHFEDAVGAGQKSGVYWLVDRDTGKIIWGTQVGPGGPGGGIIWGTATDGHRIYVPSANSAYVSTKLIPSGITTNGGFWSALDPATGKILWQTPTTAPSGTVGFSGIPVPAGGAPAGAFGSVSVGNGVMYGADEAGTFVALNAVTGKLLFSYNSGGTSVSAPAIVNGSLYWSSGYVNYGYTNNKIYALSLPWLK